MITHSASISDHDSRLDQWLECLACDIADHPERLLSLDAEFVCFLQNLTCGVVIDLDMPLLADDED